MGVVNSRGSSVSSTSAGGGAWATTTNAVDGTYGTNNATYATWTSSVASDVGYIEVSGFNFSSIPGDALSLSISVSVRNNVSNTARIVSVQFQPYDGTTAIGSPAAGTLNTGDHNDTASFSPTLAQLQSANFKVRVIATHSTGTQSGVFSLDYVDVSASYVRNLSQSVTATSVSSTASVSRSATYVRTLTDSVTGTATAVRQARRTLLDTITGTATATKRATKTLTDAVTITATRSTGNVYPKEFAATVSAIASMSRVTMKPLVDQVVSTPTIGRFKFSSKTITAAPVTVTGGLTRRAGKALNYPVSVTASLPNKSISVTRKATPLIIPAVRKLSAKSLSDGVAVAGTLAKSKVFPKVMSTAVVVSSASVRKSAQKRLSRTVYGTTTFTKRAARRITATSTTRARYAFQKHLKMTMAKTVLTSASTRKYVGTTKADVVSSTVTFRRAATITVRSLTRPTITLSFRQSLKRTLADTVTVVGRTRRGTSKSLVDTVSVTPIIRKTAKKAISATASVASFLTAMFVQGTGWLRWNGADENPTPLELLGVWDGAQIVPLIWYGEEVE